MGRKQLFLSSLVLIFIAGCGSEVLKLKAKYPSNPFERHDPVEKSVLIKTATDDREFETQPGPLSKPTYAGEKPSSSLQSHVIGAKSGMEGKDFANIYLEDVQKIEHIVSDLLQVAFEYAGYKSTRIAEEIEGEPDFVVETSISQFWIWMTPGTMTISIEADIQADVTITSGDETWTFETRAYHKEPDLGKSPDSYRFVLNEVLHTFLMNTQQKCLNFVSESAPEEEESEDAGDGF